VALPTLQKLNLPTMALDWLDERFAVRQFAAVAGKKEVPVHKHSIWYYMGGIAMVFVMVQLITGVLLMVHYVPTFDGAYESVRVINNEVEFGWLVRSMHSWGANLFILVLLFHMFSAYFMKAYRAPREVTWLTGLGLLGVAMVFGFTGYMLPMDEIAFFATKVGVDIAGSSPVIGPLLADFVRGKIIDAANRTNNRLDDRVAAGSKVSKSSKIGEISFGFAGQKLSGGGTTQQLWGGYEFGSNRYKQFPVWSGREGRGSRGWFIYPTLRSVQPEIVKRWEQSFDEIVKEFN
jgi:hypothetical protein